MPLGVDANPLVDLHGAQVFAALPVPEPEFAVGVAGSEELAVGREVESAGVARVEVARELLLPVHLEVALAVVDHHLVVHRLPCEVLPVRVHRRSWDRLHVRLAYVLRHYWDSELPQVDLLIIGS